MKVEVKLDRNMRLIGRNELGLETHFDTNPKAGGEDSAATPFEIMLEAMAACSFLDVLVILRKKRLTVDDMIIKVDAERTETHPKVLTKAHLIYELKSPDAQLKDLDRAIELSQTTYCSVSAIVKLSGCDVTWESRIV